MRRLVLAVVIVAAEVSQAGVFAIAVPEIVSTASQPAAPPESPERALPRAAQTVFLERAQIVARRRISKGVTGTIRATLTDGVHTHDASVQTVDEYKPIFRSKRGTEVGFRDTWRYNLAAYHLDTLLELEMVPVTVARKFDGTDASFTWWVDDVMMDETERHKKKIRAPDLDRWHHQLQTLRIFDQLIQNTDRNLGNMLIDRAWKVWMIDHTRAFRRQNELSSANTLTRCDRQLMARLKGLDATRVSHALGTWLREAEVAPILARRDRIVEHCEQAGGMRLYDWAPRPPAVSPCACRTFPFATGSSSRRTPGGPCGPCPARGWRNPSTRPVSGWSRRPD